MIFQAVLFLSFFSFLAFADTKTEEVASSKSWHRLLHYRASFLGGHKSTADGKQFFLSAQGKTRPLQELEKNLQAYKAQGLDEKTHFKCRFPLRYEFLQKTFNLPEVNLECKAFNWWISQLGAKSLALVYATNYPNNPMSAFGHTFLRILSSPSAPIQNSRPGESKVDLLDYMVGFAASVPDVNGLVYAYKGIFGGFPGAFHMGPYYLKVNEYNNMESRDLWEYHLDFNEQETRMVLSHLWELSQNNYFDYFFLDENCSYQMLALFEVAKLDWNLIDSIGLYLSPAESVKIVHEVPGAIVKTHYRPSTHQVMKSHLAALSGPQKSLLKKVLENKLPSDQVEDPHVLEAVSAVLAYAKGNFRREDKQAMARLKKVLMARAKLKTTRPVEILVDSFSDPLGSHRERKVEVAIGERGKEKVVEFAYRMGLHGNYDNPKGHARFSQVEFGELRLRYSSTENKAELISVIPAKLRALVPWTEVTRPLSWGVVLEYNDPLYSIEKHAYSLQAELGASFSPFFSKQVFYILPLVFARLDKQRGWEVNSGAGLTLGQLFYVKRHYPLVLEASLQKTLQTKFYKHKRLFIESGLGIPLSENTQTEVVFKRFISLSKTELNRSDFKLGFSYYF